VHPGAINVALRAIPCLYCVTDSTAASGMPDGDYKLGRHTVTKCLGGVRLADGTLAVSTLTMDQALRNLVERIGLDLADASRRVSTFAADHLGLPDRGRLQRGAWADVVVLDRDLQIKGRLRGRNLGLNSPGLNSHMLEEALEAPAAIARQLDHDDAAYSTFGAQLREQVPNSVLTVARRQLRPCGPLHGLPDHGAHGAGWSRRCRCR